MPDTPFYGLSGQRPVASVRPQSAVSTGVYEEPFENVYDDIPQDAVNP